MQMLYRCPQAANPLVLVHQAGAPGMPACEEANCDCHDIILLHCLQAWAVGGTCQLGWWVANPLQVAAAITAMCVKLLHNITVLFVVRLLQVEEQCQPTHRAQLH